MLCHSEAWQVCPVSRAVHGTEVPQFERLPERETNTLARSAHVGLDPPDVLIVDPDREPGRASPDRDDTARRPAHRLVADRPGVRHVAQPPEEFQRFGRGLLAAVPGLQGCPWHAAVMLTVELHPGVIAEINLVPVGGRLDETLAGRVHEALLELLPHAREVRLG